MRIYDIIKENTTSGSVATVNAPSGIMIQRKKSDGTAVNALDQNENIFGKRRKIKDESNRPSTNSV